MAKLTAKQKANNRISKNISKFRGEKIPRDQAIAKAISIEKRRKTKGKKK